jgi:hypothetical protein
VALAVAPLLSVVVGDAVAVVDRVAVLPSVAPMKLAEAAPLMMVQR